MLVLLFAQMKYARGTVVQCNKENRSYVRNTEIQFRHRNVGISKIYTVGMNKLHYQEEA